MAENLTFAEMPDELTQYDSSKVVLLPVPYDETSTFVKGSNLAPDAILRASQSLELYDDETEIEVYKKGIHIAEPVTEKSSPENMVAAVKQKTADLLNDDKFVVAIGGEHSISIGAIAAHAEKFDNFSVLQLDAHADLRDGYVDSKYNHACVMARVKEFTPIVQVGIRSVAPEVKGEIDRDKMFFAHDIVNDTDWYDKVIDQLTENVYITIDLDVFDPSIMPATGTPQPGGLLWYDVLKLLKKLCQTKKVVGFDVVELCPIETQKAPDVLAAKLIYKLLTYNHKTL